jgi:predicted secreted protein
MSPITWFAVYLTIWWTVLFAVLPLGSRSFHEAGVTPPPGVDPGAPINPNLKRKFITTTWVSAVVFTLFFLVVHFHLVTLPDLPAAA